MTDTADPQYCTNKECGYEFANTCTKEDCSNARMCPDWKGIENLDGFNGK